MVNYSLRKTPVRQLSDQQRLQNNNHLRYQENDQGQVVITVRGVAPLQVFNQQPDYQAALYPVQPI